MIYKNMYRCLRKQTILLMIINHCVYFKDLKVFGSRTTNDWNCATAKARLEKARPSLFT